MQRRRDFFGSFVPGVSLEEMCTAIRAAPWPFWRETDAGTRGAQLGAEANLGSSEFGRAPQSGLGGENPSNSWLGGTLRTRGSTTAKSFGLASAEGPPLLGGLHTAGEPPQKKGLLTQPRPQNPVSETGAGGRRPIPPQRCLAIARSCEPIGYHDGFQPPFLFHFPFAPPSKSNASASGQ